MHNQRLHHKQKLFFLSWMLLSYRLCVLGECSHSDNPLTSQKCNLLSLSIHLYLPTPSGVLLPPFSSSCSTAPPYNDSDKWPRFPEHFLIPHIHLANHSNEHESVFSLGQHPWSSRQKSQHGRLGSQVINGHQPHRRTQHKESKMISPHHSDYLLPSPCASNCPNPLSR